MYIFLNSSFSRLPPASPLANFFPWINYTPLFVCLCVCVCVCVKPLTLDNNINMNDWGMRNRESLLQGTVNKRADDFNSKFTISFKWIANRFLSACLLSWLSPQTQQINLIRKLDKLIKNQLFGFFDQQ